VLQVCALRLWRRVERWECTWGVTPNPNSNPPIIRSDRSDHTNPHLLIFNVVLEPVPEVARVTHVPKVEESDLAHWNLNGWGDCVGRRRRVSAVIEVGWE